MARHAISERLRRSWLPRSEHDRHVLGFYSYTFAAEVFSCSAAAVFLPIALEQLARRHGYFDRDPGRPCWEAAGAVEETACTVKVMGSWVDTASFSLFVKSAAVAVQAVTVISISVLADNSFWRKRLLLTFGWLGALAATLFLVLPISSNISLVLSALLAITSLVCFGDSFVCLNSFLPILVQSAPRVLAAAAGGPPLADHSNAIEAVIEEETALLAADDRTGPLGVESAAATHAPALSPPLVDERAYRRAVSSVTTEISSLGIALGYGSGTTMLALSIIPVSLMGGSVFSLHFAIGLTGLWWAVFTLPAAILLPSQRSKDRPSADRSFVAQQVKQGWSRLGRMMHPSEMRRLGSTFWYLLAWALMADGFNTMTAVAILFAKTSLKMSSSATIVIGILTQTTAVGSAFLTPRVQRRYRLSSKRMLAGCLWGVIALCAYVLVGLIGDLSYGGLKTPAEMYFCAVWFGVLFGPFNALSRTVFAEIIPPGQEARFFSLFSICDRGASWLGPGAIAIIADRTGEIRYGFLFLAALLAVPLPILAWCVDIDAGRRDAVAYSKEEAGIT